MFKSLHLKDKNKDKNKNKNKKLILTATTWYKDSHSLFDYQSNKITDVSFDFSLENIKGINIYRKKNSSQVLAIDCKKTFPAQGSSYEFIGHVQLQLDPEKEGDIKVNVLKTSSYKEKINNKSNQKQKTNQSIDSIDEREENPYFLVERMNPVQVKRGDSLVAGMTLKLGRVEYYISQICDGVNKTSAPREHSKAFFNENVMKFTYDPCKQQNACKICLDDSQTSQNFLFNPCKCNGSCGTVHLQCLKDWIGFKIKKQVIGGTQHYNFSKFECQVCLAEFSGFVEVTTDPGQSPIMEQMIQVDKPQGRYLLMQSVSEKEKCIMVIQTTPEQGIKIGRGHQCQIRITDISVSRKHAYIFNTPEYGFRILDNRSKFGTLMRKQDMSFNLKNQEKQSVQVGRTVLFFNLSQG